MDRKREETGTRIEAVSALASNFLHGIQGPDPLAGYIESRRISLVAPQRLSYQLKGQT